MNTKMYLETVTSPAALMFWIILFIFLIFFFFCKFMPLFGIATQIEVGQNSILKKINLFYIFKLF
jgi:hypothetical protein